LVKVSVVTATLNEAENVPELIMRLRASLRSAEHEVIVSDGGSTDGTPEVARRLADRVVTIQRGSQSACLLEGVRASRGDVVVTIDADLENPPELVRALAASLDLMGCDVVVASRRRLPRPAEVLASLTLGRLLGVSDLFSNFRAFRRGLLNDYGLRLGETFGCELLVAMKLRGARVCEVTYEPPPRRARPRVGGALRANARALLAWSKCMTYYLLARALGLR